MIKPEKPRSLVCQAGPFTADEWKTYMENYKGRSFDKLKCTPSTLINVFDLYLFERNLFIERFNKLYTYKMYLNWVRRNGYASSWYSYYSKEYIEWDNRSGLRSAYRTKERCLEGIIENKILIDQGGETEDLYKDQYKHWRKNWAVDESRFYWVNDADK